MSAALKADSLSPNARKVLAWTAKGEALNALPMSVPDLAKALQELSGRGLDTDGRRIITDYVFPPIPDRRFDWSAVRDGYEPPDSDGVGGGLIGWGATEQEAIDDLLELESE